MRVQVEASQITALEQQVNQLEMWLTVAVAKRKGKKLIITEVDFEKNQGGNVAYEFKDGKVTLTYKAANT
jgi:hypothetical protein